VLVRRRRDRGLSGPTEQRPLTLFSAQMPAGHQALTPRGPVHVERLAAV
jgi:hypothetical protein